MNRLSLIEEWLERIKYVGNLQLEYLQRLYDRRTSFTEHYRVGKAVLHLHCFRHENSPPKQCLCFQMRKCMSIDLSASACTDCRRSAMSVRIGEIADFTEPIIPMIRLQPLNHCDFFSADSFKLGRTPTLEYLRRVTNRELQTLIEVSPAKLGECDDQIIESDYKMLNNLADVDAEIKEWIGNWILELMRVFTFDGNDVRVTLPKPLDSIIQVRQAFFALSDSPISFVQ